MRLHNVQGYAVTDYLNSVLLQHPEDIPEPRDISSGQELYFEVLELQPIQLAISFMRTERVSGEDQ